MGAYITHRRRQVGCNLALHVDIPLLDVVSPGIRFDIRGGERISSNLLECTVCIGGQNADTIARRKVRNNAHEEKRRLYALLGVEVSRQRQNVKDREAATNGRFPIAARIPSKTESRLKIKHGGVRVIRGRPGAARLSDYGGKGRIRRPAVG